MTKIEHYALFLKDMLCKARNRLLAFDLFSPVFLLKIEICTRQAINLGQGLIFKPCRIKHSANWAAISLDNVLIL